VGLLVANKKGTAGKTPLSILLGGVLAAIRGGSVAILETSDDKGQLAYRAEGDPQLGMGELVANISNVRTQSQLRGYTVTQTSFASVIGSTPKWRPPLTRENVLDVASIVDEHFTIRVMDTGNQYSSGPFGAAVEVADVLVIPTMLAQDAVSEALELLEFLEHQGAEAARLARTAIVVMMSDGRPEFKPSKLKKQFMDKGIAEDHIYSVPYDSHVAERGALTLDKLAPATRQALTAIAAGVVAQTNQNVFEKDQNR
jgi:MinD-like ATPase involved in chromosome partitioning or flagellar assembly